MALPEQSCETPPTPTGSVGFGWEEDQGVVSRVVYTHDRHPDGCTAGVHISAIQLIDGRIDTASEAPGIYIECDPYSGITISQARSLAVMLVESASQLESWIETFGSAAEQSADR